eukprot:gene16280-10202_t
MEAIASMIGGATRHVAVLRGKTEDFDDNAQEFYNVDPEPAELDEEVKQIIMKTMSEHFGDLLQPDALATAERERDGAAKPLQDMSLIEVEQHLLQLLECDATSEMIGGWTATEQCKDVYASRESASLFNLEFRKVAMWYQFLQAKECPIGWTDFARGRQVYPT